MVPSVRRLKGYATVQNDRRQSRRYQVIPPEVAVLKLGKRKVQVRVRNQSADGFMVLAPRGVNVKVGDQLLLQTVAGWHRVNVARRTDYNEGWVELGLRRMDDLPREDPSGSAVLGTLLGPGERSGSNVSLTTGGGRSILTLMMVVGAVLLLGGRYLAVSLLPYWGDATGATGKTHTKVERPAEETQSKPLFELPAFLQGDGQTPQDRLDRLARLSGPPVAQKLGLSSEQCDAIRRAVRAGKDELRANAGASESYRMSIASRAEQRAMSCLNTSQRARWRLIEQGPAGS